MKPLVTTLIDTYNHERYLEQALLSVVDQGLSPAELEIIVVDDGSTDNTPSIVRKFVPRVKHVRKKNGGQASAFNAGFAEAKGQIIAPLDGDDWFEKGKITAVLEALEHDPELSAVSHAYYEYYEETKELRLCGPAERTLYNLATPDAARQAAAGWHFLPMGALTVRRQLLEQIMPLPEGLIFSADNPIQTAAMARGVLVLDKPLSYYRRHPDNLYAIDGTDLMKVRRRCEVIDLTLTSLYPMLARMGVPSDCVEALLDDMLLSNKRFKLSTFGGSRRETLRTEMRCVRLETKNPSIAYRLFKYLVVAPATLLFPPRRFYQLREWYAQEGASRYREVFFKRYAGARR